MARKAVKCDPNTWFCKVAVCEQNLKGERGPVTPIGAAPSSAQVRILIPGVASPTLLFIGAADAAFELKKILNKQAPQGISRWT